MSNSSPQFKKVVIGSDHAGFELKEAIKVHARQLGLDVEDKGCFSLESVDYPDYSGLVARGVLADSQAMGVLVCGSGIGVSIGANRYNGIRAALCFDAYLAALSRAHNDANVLCLGARVVGQPYALEIFDAFLNGPFEGSRHQTRIQKLDKLVVSEEGKSSCQASTC